MDMRFGINDPLNIPCNAIFAAPITVDTVYYIVSRGPYRFLVSLFDAPLSTAEGKISTVFCVLTEIQGLDRRLIARLDGQRLRSLTKVEVRKVRILPVAILKLRFSIW